MKIFGRRNQRRPPSGPKKSPDRQAKSDEYFNLAQALIPGLAKRNDSVTTTSIYCKTPDGYSLRIGDHDGKEKYKYKWNLGNGNRGWVKDDGKWRFYTNNVQTLAEEIQKSIDNRNSWVSRSPSFRTSKDQEPDPDEIRRLFG